MSELAERSLSIFLSYGHDERAADALEIKADLEARGHTVWFDLERLRAGRDWAGYIEEGLDACDLVVLLMTPHSVRRRERSEPHSTDGFCLNELARALERNKTVIPVMLAWVDRGPPLAISRVQYLDLTDCVPIDREDERYRRRFARLVDAVEHGNLDMGGAQARLQRYLRPLDFSQDMAPHIAGFRGRRWVDALVDEWLDERPDSQLLWIAGGPGLGKTALATHLQRRHDAAACHFCVFGHEDKANARRAVLSIAYQLAAAFPEYFESLKAVPLEEEHLKNAHTLFDNLLVTPLRRIEAPDGGGLVILDALDEAASGARNELAELVASGWRRLPSWLRLIVTSRPEPELLRRMGGLRRPVELVGEDPRNLEDLRELVVANLEESGLDAPPETVARIVEHSGGMFLYAVQVLEEIRDGEISVHEPESFPRGLEGYYGRFFERRFADARGYDEESRPLLEAVVARRAPLPLGLLAETLDVPLFELSRRLRQCGSLFPPRRSGEEERDWTVEPFHKSVVDWLTSSDEHGYHRAGDFAVDVEAGRRRLAEACEGWGRLEGAARCYALAHGVRHQLEAGRLEQAAEALCDFGCHHHRVEAGGADAVTETVGDFIRTEEAAAKARWVGPHWDLLQEWQAFYRERSHRARRHERPELGLLQAAYAHAERSHVSRSAEGWLAKWGPSASWLRAVRRPPEARASACLMTLPVDAASVALDSAGKRALSGGFDGVVKLWDLETGACLLALEGHTEQVIAVAFRGEGEVALSVSLDGTIGLWNLASGTCLQTVAWEARSAIAATTDTEGGLVFSAHQERDEPGSCETTLKLWELETGACLHTMEGHADAVDALAAIPPRGRAVSGGWDGKLKLWDLESGNCLRVLESYAHMVTSVAVDPSGRWAVSGNDSGGLELWDLETGACSGILEKHDFFVAAVAFARTGQRVFSVDYHGTIKAWDLETGECLRTIDGDGQWFHGGSGVPVAALDPENRRAVTGIGGRTLKVWDLETAAHAPSRTEHAEAVYALAVDAERGRAVSGSADHSLKLWDLESGDCLSTLRGVYGAGILRTPLAFDAARGRVVTEDGPLDGTLGLWSTRSGTLLRTLEEHTGPANDIVLLDEGKRALSAGGETLEVWDLRSGERLRTLVGHRARVTVVEPWKEGRRAISGSEDDSLRVWDVEIGECLRTLEGHTASVTALALCRQDRCALSGSSDGTLRLWELETGDCLHVLEGHTSGVNALAADPTGRVALTARRHGAMRQWDQRAGACLRLLEGHEDWVKAVALAPGAGRAVSGSTDNTLKVWDLHTGECLATWVAEGAVLCCAWPPGRIVAGTGAGEVLILRLTDAGPWRPRPRGA